MTKVDSGRDETLRMPARWWSLQWLSIRILWGLFAAGLITRGINPGDTGILFGGMAIGAVVFGLLTVIAYRRRREWADTNYPGTERKL